MDAEGGGQKRGSRMSRVALPPRLNPKTNKLARQIYALRGYQVGPKHKFYEFDRVNYHPDERFCWEAACAAQALLTDTDVRDAFEELEMEYLGD